MFHIFVWPLANAVAGSSKRIAAIMMFFMRISPFLILFQQSVLCVDNLKDFLHKILSWLENYFQIFGGLEKCSANNNNHRSWKIGTSFQFIGMAYDTLGQAEPLPPSSSPASKISKFLRRKRPALSLLRWSIPIILEAGLTPSIKVEGQNKLSYLTFTCYHHKRAYLLYRLKGSRKRQNALTSSWWRSR